MKKDNNKYNKLEADLEKAIKIYYKIAFGKEITKDELDSDKSQVLWPIKEGLKRSYLRAGVDFGNGIFQHTKLNLEIKKDKYGFSVFANAGGTVGDIEEKIENKCSEIEKALIEAGLPVERRYAK